MQNGSHRLVAVVDDDDAVRDSLRFLLEIAGYSVATYASAAQFLLDAPVDQLSCLVVDQHMPDQTGLQLVVPSAQPGHNPAGSADHRFAVPRSDPAGT